MARVYRRGKYWYMDFVANSRRRRESISVAVSSKTARKILNKRLTDIAENKYLDVKKNQKIKFKDFAVEYMETHSKPNKKSWRTTDENSLKSLIPFFGELYLYEINAQMIEKYKADRKLFVKPATVNRALNCLRTMLNKAVTWGKLYESPMKSVEFYKEPPGRVRYLTEGEINNLLNQCRDSKGNLRQIGKVIVVLLNTGMRKGELQQLKWQDVDFQQNIITLLQTKNNEVRHIPMNSVVRNTLISVRKHPESPYIFCKANGTPYNFRKAFGTAKNRAGIKDFKIHDLRHTFASHLVMSGVDLNTVRELLGHNSLSMTLRYSHLSPDHKARQVEILSQKLGTNLAHKLKIDIEEKTADFATKAVIIS